MHDLIGTSVNRIDAAAKVTGQALYPGDINLPHQAHMKMIFSSRAHAVIRAIDVSHAQKLPGVLAVLTARDVPCNEYGIISQDQPVLCGPGSVKPFTDRVRFAGDKIALVVAESEAIAEAACHLIRIDYEDLPALDDPPDRHAAGRPRCCTRKTSPMSFSTNTSAKVTLKMFSARRM